MSMSAVLRSPKLERITVNLPEETRARLEQLARGTGMSVTDQVNRALSLYEYLDAQENPAQSDAPMLKLLITHDEPIGLNAPKDPALATSETDVAGTRRLTFLIVLTWLLAIGLPLVESQLPVDEQTVITNELATVAIALAVTWRAIDKRKE
jgi:hypothetical protein